MKIFEGEYYVEVKDHRYKLRPTDKILLRKRYPPTLRTQYQIQNEIKIRKIKKILGIIIPN